MSSAPVEARKQQARIERIVALRRRGHSIDSIVKITGKGVRFVEMIVARSDDEFADLLLRQKYLSD